MLMKKFALFALIALFSVASFAQKGVTLRQLVNANAQTTLVKKQLQAKQLAKGQVRRGPARAEGESALVTPPADLQTMNYMVSGQERTTGGGAVSWPIEIGLSGTDVYVKGLGYNWPDAWIKGSLDLAAGKATFPVDQVLAEQVQFTDGTVSDVCFTLIDPDFVTMEALEIGFDPTTGAVTCPDVILVESLGPNFDLNDEEHGMLMSAIQVTSITPVVEQAGVPATPKLGEIQATNYGDVLTFNIPLEDVNGNPMVASKVTWHLMSDIAGEQSVVTLMPEDFIKQAEPLTEIPYGYTDNYDIAADMIYLNMDHSAWDRVGIQVTYTGGGETNVSAIGWLNIDKPIVVPGNLEYADRIMKASDYDGNEVYQPVKIAFDGNDVYLNGVSAAMEAVIKGQLDGAQITFPAGQYLGTVATNSGDVKVYLNSYVTTDDLVFAYNAESGVLSSNGLMAIDAPGAGYLDYWNTPVISPIVEQAGVPATPAIVAFQNPVIKFNVPIEDVNGNLMVASKVSYRIYKDIDHVEEVVTFDPAEYEKLEEAMTEVPFGFTDNWDFYNDQLYLNQADLADWNRVGIQTVYTGGGETNESEIGWYLLKDYPTVSASWVAAEQGYENAQDLTAAPVDLGNGVTMTFDKAEGANPPAYYNSGQNVRVYWGNTVAFKSPKKIQKIVFNCTPNYFGDMEASEGTLTKDFVNNQLIWEGAAKNIVLSNLYDNGKVQFRFVSLDMTVSNIDEPVVVPEGLEVKDFVAQMNNVTYKQNEDGSMSEEYDKADNLFVKVGQANGKLYIQGLCATLPEAWIEGEINGSNVTFEQNQYVGSYETIDWGSFSMVEYPIYLTSHDADLNLVPVQMTIDEETGVISSVNNVVFNTEKDRIYYLEAYNDVVISELQDVAATPADPEWLNFYGNSSLPKMEVLIPSEGTNGEALIPSKLVYQFFVIDGDDPAEKPLEFEAGAYMKLDENMTQIPYGFTDGYDFYDYGGGDFVIYFNFGDSYLPSTWHKIAVQSVYNGGGETHESAKVWFDIDEYFVAVGVKEVNSEINEKAEYTDLLGRRVNGNAKGLVIKRQGDKVVKVIK